MLISTAQVTERTKHKVLIHDGLHHYLRKEKYIKEDERNNIAQMKDAFTSEYYCSVCMKDCTEESKQAAGTLRHTMESTSPNKELLWWEEDVDVQALK